MPCESPRASKASPSARSTSRGARSTGASSRTPARAFRCSAAARSSSSGSRAASRPRRRPTRSCDGASPRARSAAPITMPRPEGGGWWEAPWFLALNKAGVIVEMQPSRARCPAGFRKVSRGRSRAPRPRRSRYLAERVEGNLLAAHQELQKLALLAPEGELSVDMVRDAVADVARFDTFAPLTTRLGRERTLYPHPRRTTRRRRSHHSPSLPDLERPLRPCVRRLRQQADADDRRQGEALPAESVGKSDRSRRRDRSHDQGRARGRAVGGVRQARPGTARGSFCTSPARPSLGRIGSASSRGRPARRSTCSAAISPERTALSIEDECGIGPVPGERRGGRRPRALASGHGARNHHRDSINHRVRHARVRGLRRELRDLRCVAATISSFDMRCARWL